MSRSIYSSRALLGRLGAFAAFSDHLGSGAEWSYQPGYDVAPPPPPPPPPAPAADGTPYYLENPNPVYGPEYRPELMPQPLPSWVVPAAAGVGAFVLLGGLTLLGFKKRKKRRR